MKKNRVNMLMDVTFKYGDDEEKTSVWIPFPVFIKAVRKFADYASVNLDGTDNAIWNLLVDFDCLDTLEDNEDILEYCREFYKGTIFEDEDYEDWKDDYEFEHNLGQYAEEN